MGFKVDTSFLKFLTMGALGTRQVIKELTSYGYEPVELERYCTTNKIWATKVKRLRLPDLLCVSTGARFEVRAKSDLKIRMSDAPNNPDRVWDAGLRDKDIIALIAVADNGGIPRPANKAVYFTVDTLRHSAHTSKLGPPKSASEGAERDRTWPATIPKRCGRVLEVDDRRIVVSMEGDGNAPRRQTYTMNGKVPYVLPGSKFSAWTDILAGTPKNMADLQAPIGTAYDPISELGSADPVDRYAACKALRYRSNLQPVALPLLEELLRSEREFRVALEAAGTAASIGSAAGERFIEKILYSDGNKELSMEAVLILTEIKGAFAQEKLKDVAGSRAFRNDERRQAAVWGLGKAGLKAYAELLPYIADSEENMAYHAIAAFGEDTPAHVIHSLIDIVLNGNEREAPAASRALKVIGSNEAFGILVNALKGATKNKDWIIATIGQFPPQMVRSALQNSPLLDRLAPMLLVAEGANWLSRVEAKRDFEFLFRQTV